MANRKLISYCGPLKHLPSSRVLFLLLLVATNNLCVSQPLINQLAVLFRARPPFPTMFPSNTNENSNNNNHNNQLKQQQYDSSNNPSNQFSLDAIDKLQLQDFSHLNNLIVENQQKMSQNHFPLYQQNRKPKDQQMQQQHNHLIQELYPHPTAQTAASILKAHQQAQRQQGSENNGIGDAKGILIAHPVLGPNQFGQANIDNKLMNLQNFKNFNNLQQQKQQQQFQNLNQPTGNNNNNNNIVAAINTGGFYLGPSSPSSEGVQIIKSQMPPPIHHHLHPNQRPITLHQLKGGKPPPGGRVIAIPIPSNTPFLIPNQNQNQNQYQQQQQQTSASDFMQSSPQFVASNLISTSHFINPSSIDSSQKVATTVSFAPTTSPTTTPTTTTGTTTTTTTTITTTKRPTTRNYEPHYSRVTTQIPKPTAAAYQSQTNLNNIQELILNSHQSFLDTSPTTVVGSFRYPDPPTKPNFQNMNTRYELQHEDVLKSYWSPPKNSFEQNKMKNHINGNGFYEASISDVSPSSNSITSSAGSNSKWKYEADNVVQPSKHENSVKGFDNNFENFDTSFRPSLQLHSFEDSTSGLKEYITINPSPSKRDSKSLFSSPSSSSSISHHFKPTEAKDLPSMESGFRPFNHYAFINGVPGASTSTTTETSVLNLIRNEFTKDYEKSLRWSNLDPTGSTSLRQERKYLDSNSIRGADNSYSHFNQQNNIKPILPTSTVGVSVKSYDDRYVTPSPEVHDSWRGRIVSHSGSNGGGGLYNQRQVTTSSSELFEDWLTPTGKPYLPETTTLKSFGYSGGNKNPLECEKFHRFGFCPVTSHYPLEQVESIGSRCSTLLSHLIAPLPKTDVRYDIIVPKNGSHIKGRSAAPSGWSWKTFAGKPVCDTKEVKIVPGYAKNEQGEWLVILQTENWKQEAQISLCTSQGAHCDLSTGRNCETQRAKCVQRFTAQRLVVLDPLNQDRCPVVRSVFLPSACVCLSNDINEPDLNTGPHTSHKKSKRHNKPSSSSSSFTPNISTSSSSDGSNSKVPTGRSLSTSFFSRIFGLEDIDLDTAADSSTSGEKSPISLPFESETKESNNSYNNNNKASSSEEGDVPVISVQNPANASSTFMVITEKVEGGESSSSSSPESEDLTLQGTFLNQTGNNSSSSSLGSSSSYIVSSKYSSSSDSNGFMENNT